MALGRVEDLRQRAPRAVVRGGQHDRLYTTKRRAAYPVVVSAWIGRNRI